MQVWVDVEDGLEIGNNKVLAVFDSQPAPYYAIYASIFQKPLQPVLKVFLSLNAVDRLFRIFHT